MTFMENFLSLARDNGFTLPDYGNSNLSVLKNIVDGRGSKSGDKGKKIFFIIDGMGYGLIGNLLADCKSNQLLSDSRLEKISTVYPSSTASVISSFETGLTTAEHGIVGWDTYSREHGTAITVFRDAPALSWDFRLGEAGIGGIRPYPRLFARAAAKGKVMFLHKWPSGMTDRYAMKNCNCVYYPSRRGMLTKLRDAINEDRHSLIYVHYPQVDHLGHNHGPSSREVRREVSSLFFEMNRLLLPALKKSDYNLVITADHGQVDSRRLFVVDRRSEIMKYLWGPPWGGKRMIYLNAMHGREEALRRHFEKRYGDAFLLVESDSAIRSGIFGKKKVSDALRYRFGTHIAIAKGSNTIAYAYPYEPPRSPPFKKGAHSGLLKEEMEVPLIVY
jgi:Type I phosphodiesterase / nucleotide pyrophosphatase